MNRSFGLGLGGLLALVGTSAVVIACSSDDAGTGTGAQSTAAAVNGAADTHCGGRIVTVDPAACTADGGAGHHDDDAGHEDDAGDHDHDAETDAGADASGFGGRGPWRHGDEEHETPTGEYGATLYGSEGSDDECKYHVSWTSSPVSVNGDVTFVVKASYLSTNQPVLGANPYTEIFLDETHPAPNTAVKTTENGSGSYTIGPVKFDQAGRWTVRFHFSADCADGDESPHGHAAFFVNVQ